MSLEGSAPKPEPDGRTIVIGNPLLNNKSDLKETPHSHPSAPLGTAEGDGSVSSLEWLGRGWCIRGSSLGATVEECLCVDPLPSNLVEQSESDPRDSSEAVSPPSSIAGGNTSAEVGRKKKYYHYADRFPEDWIVGLDKKQGLTLVQFLGIYDQTVSYAKNDQGSGDHLLKHHTLPISLSVRFFRACMVLLRKRHWEDQDTGSKDELFIPCMSKIRWSRESLLHDPPSFKNEVSSLDQEPAPELSSRLDESEEEEAHYRSAKKRFQELPRGERQGQFGMLTHELFLHINSAFFSNRNSRDRSLEEGYQITGKEHDDDELLGAGEVLHERFFTDLSLFSERDPLTDGKLAEFPPLPSFFKDVFRSMVYAGNVDSIHVLFTCLKQTSLLSAVCIQNILDAPVARTLNRSPIILAARNYHLDVMKALVKLGAHVDTKDDESWTALQIAAFGGRCASVKFLMDSGANIRSKEVDEWEALHLTSQQGHVRVAQLLIAAGADPEAQTRLGVTPLGNACTHNQIDLVRLYCKSLKVKVTSPARVGMPLHVAAARGHVEIVHTLIDAHLSYGGGPTSVAHQAENGDTPLHLACRARCVEAVKALLETEPATSRLTNDRDCLPIHYVFEEDVVLSLNPRKEDHDKFERERESSLEIVQILVGRYSSPFNTANRAQETPFIFACAKNHPDIVKYLLREGCKDNLALAEELLVARGRRSNNFLHYVAVRDLDEVLQEVLSWAEEEDAGFSLREGQTTGRLFSLIERLSLSTDHKKRTPIHDAAGHYFIGYGNNNNNLSKKKSLDASSSASRSCVLKMLLEYGIDPTKCEADDERNLPLHIAVSAKNYEKVKLLLEHGCDPDAIQSRKDQLIGRFMGHGGSGGGSKNEVMLLRPLHLAINLKDFSIVELLMTHGANPHAAAVKSHLDRNSVSFTPYQMVQEIEEGESTYTTSTARTQSSSSAVEEVDLVREAHEFFGRGALADGGDMLARRQFRELFDTFRDK